jgi:hypothetical protein
MFSQRFSLTFPDEFLQYPLTFRISAATMRIGGRMSAWPGKFVIVLTGNSHMKWYSSLNRATLVSIRINYA